VAKKFGYKKSNWQFLLAKPARMAKMPGVVLWFLGLGGASGTIANEVFVNNVSHIFSYKHRDNGIIYKVTIRFYFKDGQFGSFNIFRDWANKIVGKLLK